MTDQEIIEAFLLDLVADISKWYAKEIDFIILFGSAARGEFKKGISDIDLVIQLKTDTKQKEIEKYSTIIFWSLNEKYKTEFEKVLSTVKTEKLIDRLFKKVEESAHLYVPIFVFPPYYIDWEKGRLTRYAWRIPAIFFIHQAFIIKKFKDEGKILYGRDIRPLINPHINFWERWKAIQIPFWLSIYSLMLLPISGKNAIKYSVKAVLYELDSALDFIGHSTTEKKQKIIILKKEAETKLQSNVFNANIKLTLSTLSKYDLKIFDEALKIKLNNFEISKDISKKFILRVFLFILRANFSIVTKQLFTFKNFIKLTVVILILATTTYFGISYYSLYKLSHPKLKPLTQNPTEISTNYENINFQSAQDKKNITGWFFKKSENSKTIILVSGSDQNRIDPGFQTDKVAKDLINNGFNILMFDFRGRGDSDHAIYSIGYWEKYDLVGAYDYLISEGYQSNSIGILAISLGAGTSILSLPYLSDVNGIVLDSSYSDMHTLITRELPGRSGLPAYFSWGISFWARLINGVKFDEMVPQETLKLFPQKHFLLIHGNQDKYIPLSDSLELLASSPQSELWIANGAGHVKAYQTYPLEYIQKVTNYFNKELH